MFPDEEDDVQHVAARQTRDRTPSWPYFTSLDDVAVDLVSLLRQAYRAGQQRLVVSSKCLVANLTDLPPYARSALEGVPLKDRSLVERSRVSFMLDGILREYLFKRIDLTKIDPTIFKSNCDGVEYFVHLDFFLRDMPSSSPLDQLPIDLPASL